MSLPGGNVQDFNYGFNLGTADNGNLASLVATGTASTQTFSRVYGYDALNRLLTMTAPGDGCSGLSWTYDAWGNRTDQTETSGVSCFTFHAAADTNNRLVGYSYDAAGNMTSDGNHTYTYDAENRIIAVDGGAATYLYDALGRRTSKKIGTSFTDYGGWPTLNPEGAPPFGGWPTLESWVPHPSRSVRRVGKGALSSLRDCRQPR